MMERLKKRLQRWLDIRPSAEVAQDEHADRARGGMKISDTLFQYSAPPELGRGALKMPIMAPGVMSAEGWAERRAHAAEMAFDDANCAGFPFGGFLNTNSVAGLNAFGLYFPGYPYLAELAQRTEFRQPVETIAKEMTRKWIVFKSKSGGDKSERIRQIEEDFETFKVRQHFRKATEYDGLYGLGHLYMDFSGPTGADHSLPLKVAPETIPKGSLNGFITIDPMWTTPLVWNSSDPTRPDFYKPTSWMVLGRKTHQSRMLRFVSREVPDIIKPAYNFGGISLSQLIEPYVGRWLKTVDGVNRLINNFSILFLQTDMEAVLEGGPNSELMKRVRMFTQTRDNQGMFVTDKENEMLNQLTVSLAGLSELQAQSQEHMAMPTHLPLVVLTGITPAGLNASSDSEIEIFHDWNHSMQEAMYTDNVNTVLKVIQLNRFGDVDEDITYDFVQLKELDGEAASRVYKTKADAGIGYIEARVITPEEERKRLATDPDSGYNNLSTEMPPELTEPAPGEQPGDTPPGEGGGEGDGDDADEDGNRAAA